MGYDAWCTTRITKEFEIEFHASLGHDTKEVRFERVR
jgi:hypothetical protein